MSTVRRIMQELKNKGNEQTRRTYKRHGDSGDIFGVQVADLKVIAKTIKGNQDLACELYETGNYDAQYLAGLVADGKQMTKKQLESWVKGSTWQMISEYTVPWVTSRSFGVRARYQRIHPVRSSRMSPGSNRTPSAAAIASISSGRMANLLLGSKVCPCCSR